MSLEKAIKHAEENAKDYEKLASIYESCTDFGDPKSSITAGYKESLSCAKEQRQLAEWLAQLKLITELVQEYADKETPEKRCEDGDGECWGIEATMLIGKIADILKIDRCEEGEKYEHY